MNLITSGNLKKYSNLSHIPAIAIVFIHAFWGFETRDLVPQLVNIALTIIVPGLALLSSLRNVKIEIPYMLGISVAIGLIFKSLLLLILSLTYFIDYYSFIMVAVCILSGCYIYLNRSFLIINITQTRFDLLHLAFYSGLFFGLAMVSHHYGRLFDSGIVSGAVSSPLLDRHSFMNTAYALCTIDGLPYSLLHYEGSSKILHLPLPGLVVAAFSGTNGNLLLSTFQCFFWGVFSISCMLAFCGAYLLNRYAGILAAVVFALYFYPASITDWQYFHYFPQLFSLLGCMVFLVVTVNFAQSQPSIELVPVFLISLVSSYVCLINNQFFMVFFLAAIIYFLFMIIKSKRRGDWFIWLLPITAMLLSFCFNIAWNGQVYPSTLMVGDTRKILIEYMPFQNLIIGVGGVLSFKLVCYHLYQNSFGIGLLGLLWLVQPLMRFKKLNYKSIHLFLWSGIIISVILGSTFFIEAGASSWYWYIFALFFLFFYGSNVLCQNRVIGLLLICIIIFGVTLCPNYYRLNRVMASGSIQKEVYTLVRDVASNLPPKARILWISDHSKDDNWSRLVFELLSNKWCIYNQYQPFTTDGIDRASELYRKIKFSRTSHIISPFRDLAHVDIGGGINIKQIREIEVNTTAKQNMYLYQMEYTKHFL